ncbi:ABC transporter permease [Streptococcus orisasini]|uniref:ABC transporter permease n=1 Tax=Streptococcus orisasini TaxID=1080071 RepID=UPI00070ECC74|nr:ABC transporter permease [Streptococcus orisasini]
MHKYFVFTIFQFKMLLKNFKLSLLGLLMPILSFYIFYELMKDSNLQNNISITEYLLPAFLIIIVCNAVLNIFGDYYISYVESGALTQYKTLGLGRYTIILAIFSAVLIFEVLVTLVLLLFSQYISNINIPFDNIFNIVVAFLLVNLFQLSISLLISTTSGKTSSYTSIALLIFNFQMFLGGLTFPPEIMPDMLQFITKYLNPIYYGLILMRGIWLEDKTIFDFPKESVLLFLMSIIFLTLSNVIAKRREI